MLFTVFRDNGYDGLELLGEYTWDELYVLTGAGFYCDKWSQYLQYSREELTIVEGEVCKRFTG